MPILSWEKPKRKMSKEEWSSIVADGSPPGVYTPNMSQDDKLKWKAKILGTQKPPLRVEVRKSTGNGVQMLIVVFENESIKLSMNGSARLSYEEWTHMELAIDEAIDKINEYKKC